ncbi:MAG: 16S rRNA (adenine(1518)-N(6)/adenine(1519)-N(6))-dimethyltransferase RsmA [Muribaculaceae bacterium]|nr:16S rRNA (adenine(1518)-N(6)/adenine(1519)-N(6))-dimethyltransferase RsmA [Muribaculaceae bacterium]
MDKVKPKKALGQHFLTDESIAHRIASTVDSNPLLPIVEVGPGMGMLTKYLLEAGRNLTVVELDTESVAFLRNNYPKLDGHIVEGDFLKLDLRQFANDEGQLAVIGNYPYNISSQIFFHVLDYKDSVTLCSGMLQREVAERLAAAPGTKTRGILSVLLQAWYDVEYLFTVSENVFNPPPKVKSGVIKMTRNAVTDLGCDERLFKTVVKTTFGQRRKTIRNSLKPLIPPGVPLPDHPLMGQRPEQLSVAEFIELTNLITNLRSQ